MEEPMRRAASTAFLPLIISDSLENLKSLVSKFTFCPKMLFDQLLMLCLTFCCFVFFYLEFLFQTIVQVQSAETDQERHQAGTKTGRSRRQSVSQLLFSLYLNNQIQRDNNNREFCNGVRLSVYLEKKNELRGKINTTAGNFVID
jgi:hypothetical protein